MKEVRTKVRQLGTCLHPHIAVQYVTALVTGGGDPAELQSARA